ncbi:MAG: hypothetical protein ACLFR1_00175 [Spirochaetia bacterium]
MEPGTYEGPLSITDNSVVIRGAGIGETVINGDVMISGNNCRIQNLTIRGSVQISGNNADLTGAEVRQGVRSSGQNNTW